MVGIILVVIMVIMVILVIIIDVMVGTGWLKLASFRRGQNGQQIFVKRVFTIFATNASFLHICNIYHVIVYFSPKKHWFWPKKASFAQKFVCKSQQMLISQQNSECLGLKLSSESNFSAKALSAFAQLLQPWVSMIKVMMVIIVALMVIMVILVIIIDICDICDQSFLGW